FFWAACLLTAQEHAGHYSQADIERGFRIYGANCSPCHGIDGDQIANVNLRSGKFRHAASEEDLARIIAAGIPGTAMPPHKFDAGELPGIVAFLRTMSDRRAAGLAIGDAARGRTLFEGKAACRSCHRVRGEGSRFAPDLSDIA